MSLTEKGRRVIPLERPVGSLCWDGDELVDWVGGGTRFYLTGGSKESRVFFGYRFDRAVLSPDRRFAVIYEACGTKGLVICGNEYTREINRSYYCANAYEY